MPTPIDRDELQRLLAEQQGQLVEVLPAAEYEEAQASAARRCTASSVSSPKPPADGSALVCCSRPHDDVVLDL